MTTHSFKSVIKRNDLCPCGSTEERVINNSKVMVRLKYKQCCLDKDTEHLKEISFFPNVPKPRGWFPEARKRAVDVDAEILSQPKSIADEIDQAVLGEYAGEPVTD